MVSATLVSLLRHVLCNCVVLFYLLAPAHAHINLACYSYQSLLENLLSRHGERPVEMGRSGRNYTVVRTENEATGSWTWILLLPDGRACIADGGDEWRVIGQEKS